MRNDFQLHASQAGQRLLKLAEKYQATHLRSLFANNPERFQAFHVEEGPLLFDFSKQRVGEEVITELCNLAEEAGLKGAIDDMFSGQKINATEGRAVLHTALRKPSSASLVVDGADVMPQVEAVLQAMERFTDDVRNGRLVGFTNKAFTDIVNIGIGGSDLGPLMVTEALAAYNDGLKLHFVSNVDGADLHSTLRIVNPETTLFIVVSKTFTTQETLANAIEAKKWLVNALGSEAAVADHFAAVSTNLTKVAAFGINTQRTFGFWDWVGGRYSLWGAVGLSIMLAVGKDAFRSLLAGAHRADEHFRTTPFHRNIPVLMALIGIWNRNFLKFSSQAIIPYSHYLRRFPAYLQQADMESNGKAVGRDGKRVEHATGPIIWGEPGTNGQHAFFQLLHQGTDIVPVDFIAFTTPLSPFVEHHTKLLANCFAQAEAMMNGRTSDEVKHMLEAQGLDHNQIHDLLPHKVFDGNRPTSMLLFDELTPFAVGCLISFYEHKIFSQGVLWNLFSFDQWGVELGKELAQRILTVLDGGRNEGFDSSTSALIERVKSISSSPKG